MALPKKYKPAEAEPRIAEWWRERDLYAYEPDSTAPCFSVDTPPPYVSADHLHIGHAMSYSQAEFIVRYKRMQGHAVYYPMGFDDNGLPTERFVEPKYGIDKRSADRGEFIELCLKETREGALTYRRLWERLGISVDWHETYSTIDPRCRRAAQRSFIELYRDGLIERRDDPVQWCYHCGTSLAQADIETDTVQAELHDIAFAAPDGQPLIISTTRPELLPACVALYTHPDDDRYAALHGANATVPLFGHQVQIPTHRDVDPGYGTGLMMVCTWGDADDVTKWREDRLPMRTLFDDRGRLNDLAGRFAGLTPPEARRAIVAQLKTDGVHRGSRALEHAIGIHERCGTAAEFNCAPQWFVRILDQRERLRELADQLRWHPPFMKARLDAWLDDLKWDWCISRQRFYGVPFPVWYCRDCGAPLLADIDTLPADPTVDQPPQNARCACGAAAFEPERDVMDTWMTSSLTPLINAGWGEGDRERMDRLYPASIRVQGFEIIRTWLFYTLVKGCCHTGQLPWERAMISGWGLDEQGRKMSKRLGNFEDPQQTIARFSADAVRYWAATVSPGHDLRFSEETLTDGMRLATKLWNATRLIDSLTEPSAADTPWQAPSLSVADRWIVKRYADTVDACTRAFEDYDYSRALRSTQLFFYGEFCDDYLEIAKPRLWKESRCSDDAKHTTAALLRGLLLGTLKLYAPFLPFVTEEIFGLLYRDTTGEASIHRSRWPTVPPADWSPQLQAQSDMLHEMIASVRRWKSSQSAHPNHPIALLTISCRDDQQPQLAPVLDDTATAVRAEKVVLTDDVQHATGVEGVTMDGALAEKR